MENFFLTEFSKEVWEKKYQLGNETFEEWLNRIAGALAETDADANLFKRLFLEHKISLGGRILANAGAPTKTTVFNCFILPPESPDADSLEHIFKFAKRVAEVLKSEGGVGFHLNWIRPRGTVIRGVGILHPGAVAYFDLINKVSATIVQDASASSPKQGKALKKQTRKGAMMGVLSLYHPDVIEFIKAKQTPGRLTYFNLSVYVPDAFMEAVKKDGIWEFIYPDINHPAYAREWDGNFERWLKKGYPVVKYGEIRARELWQMLLRSTYDYAEPNLLFEGLIERYNNLSYIPELHNQATNPCLARGTKIWDEDRWVSIEEGGNTFISWKTGVKKVIKIVTDKGAELICTPDHLLMLEDGSFIPAFYSPFASRI